MLDGNLDWSRAAVERVVAHIERNFGRPVGLEELGRLAGMSPFTVQKRFKRAMGVSPLEYQRALRAGRLRKALRKGDSVTDAIYDAGFSSSSRVYEGSALGMTPSRFKEGGRGERIAFTSARSPYGWMIVGATERGLCWLSLAASKAEAEASLREEFPAAELKSDPGLARWVELALESVDGVSQQGRKGAAPQRSAARSHAPEEPGLELDLCGTAFQLRVWQALRHIPRGETRSYSQLAREMGDANATRAVARACALNRVSVLVPCHRVVAANGDLTGYRWGVERKRKLLEAEKDSC